MHLHFLALNSNVAGQHFWLLWPGFSHNKAGKHGCIFYLIHTHSVPVREGLFAGVLWWLVHLHSLTFNSNVAG